MFCPTVDGRNPRQPPGMYENRVNNGINDISTICSVFMVFLSGTKQRENYRLATSAKKNMETQRPKIQSF